MTEVVITSSVLIVAILLLRRITKEKIGMRFRYALWLLVALRLAVPFSVASSPLSVMNLLPEKWDVEYDGERSGSVTGINSTRMEALQTADGTARASGETTAGAGSAKAEELQTADGMTRASDVASTGADGMAKKVGGAAVDGTAAGGRAEVRDKDTGVGTNRLRATEWKEVLRGIWIIGMFTVAGHLLFIQVRFIHYLRRNRSKADGKELPEKWAERLAGRRISVYLVDGLPSPCLVGNAIYLTPALLDEKDKLEHVLAHEYSHLRQHDTVWAFLRSLSVVVYWFDPFVWAAAYAAKQDSELACDEAAIGLLGEESRFAYGRTLLSLLSGERGKVGINGIVMAMEGKEKGMRERVFMIARKPRTGKGVAVIVPVLMAVMCGCAFTGAQPQEDAVQIDAIQITETEEDAIQITEMEAEAQRQEEELSRLEEQLHQEQAKVEELHRLEKQLRQEQAEIQKEMEAIQKEKETLVEEEKWDEYANGEDGSWQLLCKDDEADIALYGLYTDEYGARGLKTLIAGDENIFDECWTPEVEVEVLEWAEDGKPRSFAVRMCTENTGTAKTWKLYVADRYDTGHIDWYSFEPGNYWKQVKDMTKLSLTSDKNAVLVVIDGDMVIGEIDTSLLSLEGYAIKDVVWDKNAAGFLLNGVDIVQGENGTGYLLNGEEGTNKDISLCIAIGLKLEGTEDIWYNGLDQLIFPVDIGTFGNRSFTLSMPGITENIP